MKLRMLLSLLAMVAGAAEDWRAAGFARRLRLELPAAPDAEVVVPLEFSGAQFHRWTGYRADEPISWRLLAARPEDDARILDALAIEARDDEGRAAGRGWTLDANDRALFTVRLGAEPLRLHLYYDGPALQPPRDNAPTGPIAIEPGADAAKPTILTAPTGLVIGMRGGGVGVGEHRQENYARGTIAVARWRERTFASLDGAWYDCFPRALGTDKQAPEWTAPTVRPHVPPAVTMTADCVGYEQRAGGEVQLRADLHREIRLWAHAPVVDFVDDTRYRSDAWEFTWPYPQVIPMGDSLDGDDVLVLPLAGKAYVHPAMGPEDYAAQPYQQRYATDNPEEGWLAGLDRGAQVGLAVFYERLPAIEARREWVSYRPGLHPNVYVRTNPGNRLELRLNFTDRACRTRHRLRRELRYVFLTDESPETIRFLYRAWALPLERFAVIAP